MSMHELTFLIFKILGGLAIFLLGMNYMSQGLRTAIGSKIQLLISKTTKNRFSGLALGTGLGTTVLSGPTLVMLIGFVNAGLMTLQQTVPLMIGANIGTTLAMQAISFKITNYCFIPISIGMLFSNAPLGVKGNGVGRAILGFGLLFFGMNTMSGSIVPYREVFAHYLQGVNGSSISGVLIGILVSCLLTAVWQSSSATIAIVFSLISAGVFKEFSQVFPIVLGAHIGTCTTALIGSIGSNIEARRTAASHLVFNVFNVVIAIALKPFFYYLVPMSSSHLVRQTANLHTFVMLMGAIVILPITQYFTQFVRFISPSNNPVPEPSYLNYQLIEFPERGIVGMISELQRIMKICAGSLNLTARIIFRKFDKDTVERIKSNEQIIDDVKLSIREYIGSMTKSYLSRRQIIMSDHLNRCMTDIERVGDHIDSLCDLALKQPEGSLDKDMYEGLCALYEKAQHILQLTIESLNPQRGDFQTVAMEILRARDGYLECSIEKSKELLRKIENHEICSIGALYFYEYVSNLDRMVKHIEGIALAQKNEDFWIKKSKLNRKTQKLEKSVINPKVDPNDYLDKLQMDNFL